MNAQRGAFSGQISEEQLIQMLESITEKNKPSTKVCAAPFASSFESSPLLFSHRGFDFQVTIQRRRADDDW